MGVGVEEDRGFTAELAFVELAEADSIPCIKVLVDIADARASYMYFAKEIIILFDDNFLRLEKLYIDILQQLLYFFVMALERGNPL